MKNRQIKRTGFLNKAAEYLWSRYVNVFCASPIFTYKTRYYLYRVAGIKEKRIEGYPKAVYREQIVFGSKNIKLGVQCFFNRECFINNKKAFITIGDYCSFGPRVSLITSTHDTSDPKHRAGAGASLDIIIGDGVWVGANSTILPGVAIGDGVIIGAGAVVNKDCEPHCLYAGVPAKFIKKLHTQSGVFNGD